MLNTVTTVTRVLTIHYSGGTQAMAMVIPSLINKINQKIQDRGPYLIKPFYDEGSSIKITYEAKVVGYAAIQLRWEILGEAVQLFLAVYPEPEQHREVPKGMRLLITDGEKRWQIPCNGSRQYQAILPPGTYQLEIIE